MTPPSPLATVAPWDLVSAAYVVEVVPVFAGFAEDIRARLRAKFGDGPRHVSMFANVGVARA